MRTIQYSNLGQSNAPKKSKLATIGVYALALLAIAGSAYIFTQEVHAQSVYSVCQEARISNTISEDTCGDMQDKYSFEYLCESANSSPDTHCWVEAL